MKEEYKKKLEKLEKRIEELNLIEEILSVEKDFKLCVKYTINRENKEVNLKIENLKDLVIFSLAEIKDEREEELREVFSRVKYED